MTESMRKLKLLARKVGSSCIDRARPYYEALERSKAAQQECQRAAVKFQKANGTFLLFFDSLIIKAVTFLMVFAF